MRPPQDTSTEIILKKLEFRLFQDLIYRKTGIALDDNKHELVQSRLRKRLNKLGLSSYQAYFEHLQEHKSRDQELQELVNRITTNKTNFFRESHHFDYLRETLFPEIIDAAQCGHRPKKLRIWCAAASTGQEPYSLAMTVHDVFAGRGWDIRILASDIDTAVLEQASEGVYDRYSIDEIDQRLRSQYFTPEATGKEPLFRIRPEISDYLTFRCINLIDREWPIRTQFDAIFCRNVLIYFDRDTHDQVTRQFAGYLAANGRLFIGHSESLSRLNDVYQRVGRTIYSAADYSAANPSNLTATVSKSPTRPISTLVPEHPPEPLALPPRTESRPQPSIESHGKSETQPIYDQSPLAKKSIIVGEVFADNIPTEISTFVGSCITACLFDQQAAVGGMNHFALPMGETQLRTAANFGVQAMEVLINQIMHLGGQRHRFQAKVFGGADVLHAQGGNSVGQKNVAFIRSFLETESIPIVGELLGGSSGLRVLFETHTGRTRVKYLDSKSSIEVARDDMGHAQTAKDAPTMEVTLF